MQSINRFLYGPTIEERVRQWQSSLRSQQRMYDREIMRLKREMKPVERQVKLLASKGEFKNAKLLARELVRSKKQLDRMETGKAELGSIYTQLGNNLTTIKVTGVMRKSTEIMKSVSSMVNLGQFSQTMQTMSMEMMKAGIMNEMVEDALEGVEDEELDTEADAEVDKVLFELTDGKLGQTDANLPKLSQAEEENTGEDAQQDLAKFQEQLNQLISG